MAHGTGPNPGTPGDRPAAVPQWYAPASAAAVLVIGVLVGLRGFHTNVLTWGRPFWDVTYDSGFIRRGLVGSIFQGLFSSAGSGTQSDLIVAITVATAFLVLGGVAAWLALLVAHAPSRGNALRITLISLPIVASSLFSMLVFTTGYLDGLLLLITGGAAALLARGHLVPAVIVGCVAPFVHELSVYLWVPVAVFGIAAARSTMPGRRWWIVIPTLCAPLVAAVAVVGLGSRSAVAHEIAIRVAGTDQYRATLLRWEFGQTLSSAWHRMDILQHRFWWPTEPAALVYFCWPALLAVTLYLIWRWRAIDYAAKASLVLAVVTPWTALILAWDLSRLILLANAMVLIVIFAIETLVIDVDAGRLHPAIIGGLLACTVFAMALPFMYVYFNHGYYLHHGPLSWSLMPLMRSHLAHPFHLR
jgi:hypothetical protein